MIIAKNGVIDAEKTIDAAWQTFITDRRLSPEQLRIAKEALDRLCREYPAFVNNQHNQEEISGYLVSHKQLPTWETVRGAYLELAATGRLFLDPSRIGVSRFGEEGIQGYVVTQLSADELQRITTPARPQSEREAIDKMNADEFYASEYGRPLREERNRRADEYIREQQFQQGESAIDFFLAANRDYSRTNNNRALMLKWLDDRKLPLNTNTLQQAFDSLKDHLELSPESNAEYGATRVVDYSDLGEKNPFHNRPERQHVELVDQRSVKKITWADIRKMSPEQYAAALADTDLAPQIEALLQNF